MPAAGDGLTIAVTGPTGEIGKPFVPALERAPEVKRILGMARRPFDPATQGWRRTQSRRGDGLERAAVERLVARGTAPPKRCASRSRRSTPARSYAVTSVTGTPKRRSASPITSSSR